MPASGRDAAAAAAREANVPGDLRAADPPATLQERLRGTPRSPTAVYLSRPDGQAAVPHHGGGHHDDGADCGGW